MAPGDGDQPDGAVPADSGRAARDEGAARRAGGGGVTTSAPAGRVVSTLGGAHYTATKTGLLGLTRAAAKELGVYGITVNAVCPGMIDTELTRESASPGQLARL